MSITNEINQAILQSLKALHNQDFTSKDFQINQTRPEFEGDYTVVLFSLVKSLKMSPDGLGKQLGEHLVNNYPSLFSQHNLIKGFLNLTISPTYWSNVLINNFDDVDYGKKKSSGQKVVVEYSSPNTNKPLHLGHLRNNFLGWSIAEILKAHGNDVIKTCIVNDRGVHICKSMLAWKKFSEGKTPDTTGIKGDHLVGDYYVMFENELKKQSEPLLARFLQGETGGLQGEELEKLVALQEKLKATDLPEEKRIEVQSAIKEMARNHTPVMQEVREMLLSWEQGEEETLKLWKTMNQWVYDGFDITYKNIGSDFDKIYYESETYLLGKEFVEDGLNKGVFFKKEDGSVWIDLTEEGLDQKLVLRKDGTSVYMTQDLGLAQKKYDDFKMNQSIYVIADEQNYHMKVLQLICEKLGLPNADGIHHLSYGMVELPTGRMKSREGTVVDADDLVTTMESIAAQHTQELGKVKDFEESELQDLYHTIGMGALKFYLLRVDPKKRMIFNPEESIDFHGYTGPFIQYTHARIRSILRRESIKQDIDFTNIRLHELEKELLISLEQFPQVIQQAAFEMDPSGIANYVYNLAKSFNSFYAELSVMQAETDELKQLRLRICAFTANVIRNAMNMLGIKVPERM